MAKRNDIHRPGAIIPAHYSYRLSYALATVVDGWPCPPFNIDLVVKLQSEKTFAHTGGIGKCSVCGANFIYGDVWVHEPTGEHIHIGHDCAAKYDLLADRSQFELDHGRIKAATGREAAKAHNRERRQALLNAHEGLEAALETDNSIVRDIKARFHEFHTMSEKQIALVFKLAQQEAEKAKNPEKLVKAPEGRVTFEGVVVSAKAQEGRFGVGYKMTVKVETPEGNWLAWGTVPSAVLDSAPVVGNTGRLQNLRGARVSITATLKAGRDAHFAITSRPSGRLIKLATPELEKAREEEIAQQAEWARRREEEMAEAQKAVDAATEPA